MGLKGFKVIRDRPGLTGKTEHRGRKVTSVRPEAGKMAVKVSVDSKEWSGSPVLKELTEKLVRREQMALRDLKDRKGMLARPAKLVPRDFKVLLVRMVRLVQLVPRAMLDLPELTGPRAHKALSEPPGMLVRMVFRAHKVWRD